MSQLYRRASWPIFLSKLCILSRQHQPDITHRTADFLPERCRQESFFLEFRKSDAQLRRAMGCMTAFDSSSPRRRETTKPASITSAPDTIRQRKEDLRVSI